MVRHTPRITPGNLTGTTPLDHRIRGITLGWTREDIPEQSERTIVIEGGSPSNRGISILEFEFGALAEQVVIRPVGLRERVRPRFG